MKVIALISAAVALLLVPAASAQQYSDTYMVCLVNKERTQAGLSPLGLDSALTQAAQQHSNDMAANNNMDHTGSDGSSAGDRCQAAGFQWTAVAENIAYGQQDADEVMQVWMDSPGHRENILNPQYTMMGSAVSQGGSTPYYTQNFACDGGEAKNVPTCDGTEQAAAPSKQSSGGSKGASRGGNGNKAGGDYSGSDNASDNYSDGGMQQQPSYSTGGSRGGNGGRPSRRGGRQSGGYGGSRHPRGGNSNGQMMYGSDDSGMMNDSDQQWFGSQGFGQNPMQSGGSRSGRHPRGGSFGGRMMSPFGGGMDSFGSSMGGGGGGSFGPPGSTGGGFY